MVRRALVFVLLLFSLPIAFGALVGLALSSVANPVITVAVTVVVVIGVLLIMLALVAGSWRPVRRLIAAAGKLADGDYSVRVTPRGSTSMRSVVGSFNQMAAQLETSRDQRRRLLADIGHELRTPLTVLRGELEAMVDGVHRADTENLASLLDDVAVMERLLDDLRTLSLAEAGALDLHRETTDVSDVVRDVADSFAREAAESGCAIHLRATGDGDAFIDGVRIRQVVSNLVVNALRAMPDGGRIDIEVQGTPEAVTVRIADTGIGIEPEARDRVFDRFHKGSGSRGSGLGLTISRDLVEAHGGAIEIEATSDQGTTIRVELPRSGG